MVEQQMKYLNLFLWAFLLTVSFVFQANQANAKICGCYLTSSWWCAPSMNYCVPKCGANFQMFPTRAACWARGVATSQPAKVKTTAPKSKVAQVSEPKKPATKPERKRVVALPSPQKPKVVERKAAPHETEPVQSKVAAVTPQLKQASVEPSKEANSAT